MTDAELIKYPRTPHLEGSRLQYGDQDLAALPVSAISGRPLVVEEKLDGANAALSFASDGRLRLQSRGHFLTGGGREQQFDLFKQWAYSRAPELHARLGDRYILYGEWLYAKHTIFYDALPAYFVTYDLFDRTEEDFLSTQRRGSVLAGLDLAVAPVLYAGAVERLETLTRLIGPSRFKTPGWETALLETARRRGQEASLVLAQTDRSALMEGLYIKIEEDGRVTGRCKFVRADFLAAVVDSGSHWQDRPILPNRLRAG